MTPSEDRPPIRWPPLGVIFLLLAAAAVLLITITIIIVPFEYVQPWGALIRRADDVTPARHARLLHVCWFFACASSAALALVTLKRQQVQVWFERLAEDARKAVANCRPSQLRSRKVIVLAALIAVGAAFRLAEIDAPVAYDEAYSYINFARRSLVEAMSDYNSPNNHLLNTLCMHVMHQFFGQTAWAFRLPVFVAGIILLAIMYIWARRLSGESTAILTLALAACSPPLVVYSVDARGYTFILCATVTMDQFLRRIHQRDSFKSLNWLVAWLAMVLGLFAIPIMVYPVAGIAVWYLLAPLATRSAHRLQAVVARGRDLGVFFATGATAVAALYAPGYIFRGLVMATEPIMAPLPISDLLTRTPQAWLAAASWWSAGPIPQSIWWVFWSVGLWSLFKQRQKLLQIAIPFAMLLVLTAVQRVAPPPRVFLFLTPWALLLMARGASTLLEQLRLPKPSIPICAGLLMMGTAIWASSQPTWLADEHQTVYLHIPDVVDQLVRAQSRGEAPDRLLAPLPTDLPSRYYIIKRNIAIPLNGTPEPGETVWLIAEPDATPDETLGDVVLKLDDMADNFDDWTRVRSYPHLTVWRGHVDRRARSME